MQIRTDSTGWRYKKVRTISNFLLYVLGTHHTLLIFYLIGMGRIELVVDFPLVYKLTNAFII